MKEQDPDLLNTFPGSIGYPDTVTDFNNTQVPFPESKTIADIFEEQVIKTPEQIAIRFKDQEITYRELNRRVNKLAYYLINSNTKKNDNIGILLKRCPEMIIAMLAILKAGASYVPISPEYPVERQEYIISQSAISIIITNNNLRFQRTHPGIKAVFCDDLGADNFPDTNPGLVFSSRQLAYTIYTSGSTGRPKGVMIEHRSVVNLALWVNDTFNVGSGDRILFITSICFDLSVYDIFGILFSGGSIVIAESNQVIDFPALALMLQKYKVTFWDSVPTTLDFLIRNLESTGTHYLQTDLRLVFLSGDWIPVGLPDRIQKFFPNAQVISLGGATEATVWSNYFPINKVDPSWKSIPYGKPIANNFFYILDADLKPVSEGEHGELFIGGIGVARGYANDDDKSKYAFMDDPFNKSCGGRMYRTGDLGRMMPDGNMEFLGRKDQQVKINGFRVELGEIESILWRYKFVDQAVVVTKDINGLKRLAGYIIPKTGYDRGAMLSFLKRKLPGYMIPGLWMELESIPLNANGKIDRNALPEIENDHGQKDFLAPRNVIEQDLVQIWQAILGVSGISINDNFFDLGGQSLLAIQMLVDVEKKFNRKININAIFKFTTVEALALFLAQEQPKERYKSLSPIKATGNKMPLYIIHGDGYNLSAFRNLALYLDEEQPLFGLQYPELDEMNDTYDNLEDIACNYVSEILRHNPDGPYALAGYSYGGYVAIEMKRQLEASGKKVKMLGIFDTDAANLLYKKSLKDNLSRKILRQFPKALFIMKSLILRPSQTIEYQTALAKKIVNKHMVNIGLKKPEERSEANVNLEKIISKHNAALNNYTMKPFYGVLHLFKAGTRIYFVDDFKYLGWRKYAKDRIQVYDVPGDYKTMFLLPHVKKLGRLVQEALDHC